MANEKSTGKAGRPARTLDEEIAAAEAKLKALREKKKEDERRERERNLKAILTMIKDEELDLISADKWKANLPKMKELFNGDSAATPKTAKATAASQTNPELEKEIS